MNVTTIIYFLVGLVFANIFYLRNKDDHEASENGNGDTFADETGYDDYYERKSRHSMMSILLICVTVFWPLYFCYIIYKEYIK